MTKSVIVTMYFNLKTLKDSSQDTRPLEFYLTNGRGTLQLEHPMIIFCDSTTQPLIKAIRDEYVSPEKCPTIYIEKNFTDYDYYNQTWPIIVENRKRSKYYKNPNDRNTPSYYLVCMFKIMALQMAAQRDDFGASHYFWIDFGCSHVAGKEMKEPAERMLENPRPKVSALYLHYKNSSELQDVANFCDTGACAMACTVFSVERAYVSKLYSCMWAIFYDLLAKGHGHTDEQVMTLCYDRHPDLFNLYYGDYYSVISNYHYVFKDWHTVKWCFINNAIAAGRQDLAKAAAQNILDSISANFLTIPDAEKAYIESVVSSE
jgi:hypothetical protein